MANPAERVKLMELLWNAVGGEFGDRTSFAGRRLWQARGDLLLAGLTARFVAVRQREICSRRRRAVGGPIVAITITHSTFSQQRSAVGIILLGILITFSTSNLSYSFHAYQAELFPTRIRARAVGFVYSWSRFSTVDRAPLRRRGLRPCARHMVAMTTMTERGLPPALISPRFLGYIAAVRRFFREGTVSDVGGAPKTAPTVSTVSSSRRATKRATASPAPRC